MSRGYSKTRYMPAHLPAARVPSWYVSPTQTRAYNQPTLEYPSYSMHRENPSKHRYREQEVLEDQPHTIDVIGNGRETTICGHINLLRLLPLHHDMHRELLETFKKKPGNYEGKYNDGDERRASVVNYGKGYLAIHFTHDITRPEMSEFLVRKGWQLMNAHCAVQNGTDLIYEKWTNVLSNDSNGATRTERRVVPTIERYY